MLERTAKPTKLQSPTQTLGERSVRAKLQRSHSEAPQWRTWRMFFRRGANLRARRDAVCRGGAVQRHFSLIFQSRQTDESSKRRSAEALCQKISLNKPSLIYR